MSGFNGVEAYKRVASAKMAKQEATRRLRENRKLNDAEFAYSPSTFAVGIRWDPAKAFLVFNVYYPMYGQSDMVTDWVSVGKGTVCS